MPVPKRDKDLWWITPSQVITCTDEHHEIRHYDFRAQRRPTFRMQIPNVGQNLRVIRASSDNNYCCVSDTVGGIYLLDRRNSYKMLGSLRTVSGCCRDIAWTQSGDAVVTTGLDRTVTLFDRVSRQVVQKMYVKQKMNQLLLLHPEETSIKVDVEPNEPVHDVSNVSDNEDEEEPDQEVWQEIEKLGKRKRLPSTEDRVVVIKKTHKTHKNSNKKKRKKHFK